VKYLMVIDTLYFGKKISHRNETLHTAAEDSIYPIVLGCYDKGISEEHLAILKKACLTAGFSNTIMLNDIPEANQSLPTKFNLKFKFLIEELKNPEHTNAENKKMIVICPIFYIHNVINSGPGKGMISEFLDVINHFPYLREFTVVLKDTSADFIEQLDFLHPRNVYGVSSLPDGIDCLVSHLKGHLGFITQTLWQPQPLKSKNPTDSIKEVGQ